MNENFTLFQKGFTPWPRTVGLKDNLHKVSPVKLLEISYSASWGNFGNKGSYMGLMCYSLKTITAFFESASVVLISS
jgi:hypothetical protein